MNSSPELTRRAIEAIARNAYGRLVAMLAKRFGDIAAAEDALAEALSSALTTWPERGIPNSPDAWLFAAAKNKLASQRRHAHVQEEKASELALLSEEKQATSESSVDHRLELLFVCAHPSIEEGIRTPLMLQTVLGLDAERIAAAFLVAPKTMGQRLSRAKTKIREARIPFVVPDLEEWPERLGDVLAAIYAAYGTGWDDVGGCSADLTEEAVFLGRLVVSLLPDEPEALGLLSLMLFCESRRNARRDEQSRFVPLIEQNVARWSRDQIIEADSLLMTAARKRCFGRFQCEAAIQSVHAQRAITGILRHDALLMLYDLLFAHSPTVGVAVARAAALGDAGDLDAAVAALIAVRENSPIEIETYQPYWVTQARVMQHRGEIEIARKHLQRGIGLTEDPAVREYLKTWLREMSREK